MSKNETTTETTSTTEVRISKRTGKPVRKYTKTGASKLYAQGISPRTGKAIRKYEKTGAAAKRKAGISPRTGKPVRKYTKSGLTVKEVDAGQKVVDQTAIEQPIAEKVASDKGVKKVAKRGSKKVIKEEVVVSE